MPFKYHRPGGAGGFATLGAFYVAFATNGNNFSFFWVDHQTFRNVTEANRVVTTPIAFTLTRIIMGVSTNSKSGDSTYQMRDDGVSIGTVTIGAGLIGDFDSGSLTNAVAAASEICPMFNNLGTGAIYGMATFYME